MKHIAYERHKKHDKLLVAREESVRKHKRQTRGFRKKCLTHTPIDAPSRLKRDSPIVRPCNGCAVCEREPTCCRQSSNALSNADDDWVYHKMKLIETQTNPINTMSNVFRPEVSPFNPVSVHLLSVKGTPVCRVTVCVNLFRAFLVLK